jgi:hypothetical protein
MSVECKMFKTGKALVCPSTIAQTDKSRLEIPELGCQEMHCRKPFEAQFKSKMQLTSHTEPILEIRSSALRECKMKSVECKMFKTGKALVCPSTIAQTDKSRLEIPELEC